MNSLLHGLQKHVIDSHLDVLALFPSTAERVPVLRSRHNHGPLLQKLQVSRSLSRQLDDALAEALTQALGPVSEPLSGDLGSCIAEAERR